MSVSINKTNGDVLAIIPDSTANGPGLAQTNSSLFLIGRNYTNYGELVNENFVRLLENFANANPPGLSSSLLTGQLWYDTDQSLLKVWQTNGWKSLATMEISNSTPVTPAPQDGHLWYDTVTEQLKIYGRLAETSGGLKGWKIVGPAYSYTQSQTGSFPESIIDSNGNERTCIVFRVGNTPIAIFTKLAFTINTTLVSTYSGLGPALSPGLNFVTDATIPGFTLKTDNLTSTTLDAQLDGNFVKSDENGTIDGTLTLNSNSGLYVGTNGNVRLLRSGTTLQLNNLTANGSTQLSVTSGTGTLMPFVVLDPATVKVRINAITEGQVFTGTTFTGTNFNGNFIGNLTATNISTSSITKSGTNGTGDIGQINNRYNTVYAGTFSGQSVQAQYADLAERFEADNEYLAGTVVELGGEKEITKVKDALSNKVFGVVSSKAAYLMNATAGSNKTHPPVAVSGRVPVNVIGKVKKGDRLVSAGNGLARAGNDSELTPWNVIGRALIDKNTENEGVIEAIVKLNS